MPSRWKPRKKSDSSVTTSSPAAISSLKNIAKRSWTIIPKTCVPSARPKSRQIQPSAKRTPSAVTQPVTRVSRPFCSRSQARASSAVTERTISGQMRERSSR
jgi:hypothetical protein